MPDTTERDPRDYDGFASVDCCDACGAPITASDGPCYCDEVFEEDAPCGEECRNA